MITDNGGPAFPVSTSNWTLGHQDGSSTWQFPGMSLRDYFAATALQGMLASGKTQANITKTEIANVAYGLANAMLKAREEK